METLNHENEGSRPPYQIQYMIKFTVISTENIIYVYVI